MHYEMNLGTLNIFVIGSRLQVPEKLISRLRTSRSKRGVEGVQIL